MHRESPLLPWARQFQHCIPADCVGRLKWAAKIVSIHICIQSTSHNLFHKFGYVGTVRDRPEVPRLLRIEPRLLQQRPYCGLFEGMRHYSSLKGSVYNIDNAGNKSSRHSFNNHVGRGSSLQDLVGEFLMISLTSSTIAGLKNDIDGPWQGDNPSFTYDLSQIESKPEHIFSIFPLKKSPNLSAREELDWCEGNELSSLLFIRLSKIVNNDFWLPALSPIFLV